MVNSRGRLVTFYRSGDSDFKGIRTSINKQFPKFDSLLNWLSERINIPGGVNHLFEIPNGLEIKHIDEIRDGCSYVASKTRRWNRSARYGDSKEQYWSNRVPSASKFRRNERNLLTDPRGKRWHSYPNSRASMQSGPPQAQGQIGFQMPRDIRPRVLTIISNTTRNSREKVILNPQTTQTYEEMLQDITGMLRMQEPPVTALWTTRKPYRKVSDFALTLNGEMFHIKAL